MNLFGERPFENRMTRGEVLLGWLYLPLHLLVLPLLLSLYALMDPTVSEVRVNLIYFGVGVSFVLLLYMGYFRDCFNVFWDAPGRCIVTMAFGLAADYAMSLLVTLVLLLLGAEDGAPNNTEVMQLAGENYGVTKALAVFAAPIVEETLFRGVVFGSIRPKSRVWAYAVSAVLFSLFHVWQYALAYGDPRLLLYALQYLPVSLVLAWCYDRTGSIWTSIFFHMGFNALSFTILSAL